ncbi:MAG TPA: gluconate 2-dehydrogenase subunit 3 family protein [Pseudomonadales bacterium]|nr:gluconate 2-dehydrogenase subunit 3 family protein [Pseudomonadales bacterium]
MDQSRREFVKTVGVLVPVGLAPSAVTAAEPAQPAARTQAAPAPSAVERPLYVFFNAAEADFIEAAVERLIPADETGPGALQAGVTNYLDKQLGGAWGAGERLYRSGPWQPGAPTQGYQLPFTPAELFHVAIRAINTSFEKQGTTFSALSVEQQDAYLKSLESGSDDLDGVPAKEFFSMLLKMTVEGYFADPVYGGNKDMAAWKMIGFPGAYADYYTAIDRHGIKFEREPMSLASDARGHIHVNPNIPASI